MALVPVVGRAAGIPRESCVDSWLRRRPLPLFDPVQGVATPPGVSAAKLRFRVRGTWGDDMRLTFNCWIWAAGSIVVVFVELVIPETESAVGISFTLFARLAIDGLWTANGLKAAQFCGMTPVVRLNG